MQKNDPSEAEVLADTRQWLERAVLGLNLCPYARAPYALGRVRMRVCAARAPQSLLDDLLDELERLQATPPEDCETTLLIHPWVLNDFLDFNDFLDAADAAVEELELEGVLQVASFHPQYRFEGSAEDDVENYSNRSPYPTLHLLREASIEAVLAAHPESEHIYERNMETLRRLGRAGWRALWAPPPTAAGPD